MNYQIFPNTLVVHNKQTKPRNLKITIFYTHIKLAFLIDPQSFAQLGPIHYEDIDFPRVPAHDSKSPVN